VNAFRIYIEKERDTDLHQGLKQVFSIKPEVFQTKKLAGFFFKTQVFSKRSATYFVGYWKK